MDSEPILTARYTAAIEKAQALHHRDIRKGTTIPYLSHLLSVSALVLEHGGSEDQAIAALLHDAAEDHGGLVILEELQAEFGDAVANIVAACSDSLVENATEKAPWRDRKTKYLAHVAEMPDAAVLVSGADKLHNARAILADYRRHGEDLWDRFNPAAGWAGTCWYYKNLARELGKRLEPLGADARALSVEFDLTVDALSQAVRAVHPDLDSAVENFAE